MSRATHNVLQGDDNGYRVMGGVSSSDNTIVLNAEIDPITGRLLVDSSGGAGQVLTPTGLVNGSNTTFTVPIGTVITSIVIDGETRYSGFGYTYVSGTGTISVDPLNAPTEYIRINTSSITGAGQVNSIVAGTNITVNNADPANPIISATSGSSSGFQQPTSGVVNGTNKVFVWATVPNAIVVDQGKIMQAINSSPDSNINWTGTTTTTLQVAPTFDIYSVA